MASTKKQKGMVFHQEGATTPAAAPAGNHPPACFIVPKPGKASEGGMEKNTCVTYKEADMIGKPNMYPSKEAIGTSGGVPAMKHPASSNLQSDNLSPDCTIKGISVTLDNNGMWNEFFRCKTEMILTKQGSRMFPYCRFRISGLQPSKKYSLIMDIQPSDNSRYKWTCNSWQVAGKAECHVKSQPFAHPESPATGQHWMQNPVSFYKLRLTNNITDQEGNTILHPMHRYLPRLHVVQTDKAAKDIKLSGASVVTFTFPQTGFMAVTAYQNSRFAQLKVEYNPFTKGLKEDSSSLLGLKLKLNSGKDLHKDGGTSTNEQHPLKKSLKSLLANHKPKSSKPADLKPSVSGENQKDSTTNSDQSAAKVTEDSLGNSHPPQKLFSELIREAHVSLQRCNLEQLGINNSPPHRTERSNTITTASKSNRQDFSKRESVSVRTGEDLSPAKTGETVVTKTKVKGEKDRLNSVNCKDTVRRDCSKVNNVATPAVPQNSSVDSDHHFKPEEQSEVKVRQHKRPAPLPLPALALFLKQHSTKSKKSKSKPGSPPALPSESLSEPQSSCKHAEDAAGQPATGPSMDLTGGMADGDKSDNRAFGHTTADLDPDGSVLNISGPAWQPSSLSSSDTIAKTGPEQSRTDDFFDSISVCESTGPEPAVPDGTPVLPNPDQPFCILGTSISIISPTLSTSSVSPILSPPHDAVLLTPDSPQTAISTEPLPSDSPAMKSDYLLPDPECSSLGFEPLSPASSPEPLPSLPASLTLQLASATSEPTPQAVPPEELPHSEDSAASVFKWHTVLPPPEPYIDNSFTTFQPTTQTVPLTSVTSPLLPSQTCSQPEPQTFDSSTSTPPPDPSPSFQDNEQSMPFPAELSPLALQLPLSPTFSSLDGDGLSPTPSLTDLVHFFSTNDDLGMEVDFSNTEAVAVPCPLPSTVEANAHEISQHVQPIPANKPSKRKKKFRRQKLAQTDLEQKIDDATYTRMQPNLEEVEEQLFISFTSKEALKLHVVDSSEEPVSLPQRTPEGHLQENTDTAENVETVESLQEKIAALEKILLRNLKLMRHRQVIHPVLQEVGLKMNLLDPTQSIDLQYLGVRLPIPPPGVSLEPLTQELPPSQGVCAAFVSRTGKTTDVTQIKGWREKFTPPETPPTPAPPKPEASQSSDLPKKNLSAFCSDMLDEYLENEGKLIDERAASFSQPQVEPLVYELPTRSTSYVRTLDSVLKKNTAGSPTSDLISGFIPPSKRPKLTLKETRTSRRETMRQKGSKQNKPRPEPAAAPSPTDSSHKGPKQNKPRPELAAAPSPADLHQRGPKRNKPRPEPAATHSPVNQNPVPEQLALHFPDPVSSQPPTVKKGKRLKPKTSSKTLSPSKSRVSHPGVSEDMAPLESDSELGPAFDQSNNACRTDGRPVMTRALLKQKDLEDGVVWEGRARTSINEERASIALTSLFTLMGFVRENPTAPIQLVRRRAPPCLNDFCRLGCVCSSLSHCSRTSHCGRPACMFGCSCLKQKVVLLKNLDGSDSSPSRHGNKKKKKRKRRMKMAYILKEADSVSQPAERVQTLWKRDDRDWDPEPTHIPKPATSFSPPVAAEGHSSCARVRGYRGKKKIHKQKQNEPMKDVEKKVKRARMVSLKQKEKKPKETKTRTSSAAPGDPVPPVPSEQPPSPPAEPPPKPSKRLIIMAECKWASKADRSFVLKDLCERMAWDQLEQPFWIKKYMINPVGQTVEESSTGRCIQYKIHITRPSEDLKKPAEPVKPEQPGTERETQQEQQEQLKQAEPVADWQQEMKEEEEEEEEEPPERWHVKAEEAESFEDWQQEVEEEEVEPLQDWRQEEEEAGPEEALQQELEEGEVKEEAGSTVHQMHDGRESRKEKKKPRSKKFMVGMGLPFLTGISPAGFLSANKKQPGGTDHLIRVNGKPYPLAKIQLGRMGALHPANRLAAYLTGRVGLNRKKQGSSSSSSLIKPPQIQTSAPTSQPSVTLLKIPTGPSVLQPAALKIIQSAASSKPPADEAPEMEVSRLVMLKMFPGPKGGGSLVRGIPRAPGSSSLMSDPQVSSSVAPAGSQLLMLQVPRPPGKLPVPASAPPSSVGQRMVLQQVQTVTGAQYYRRPDGKLVQLVPIDQLTPVKPAQSAQRGSSPPPVTRQTPSFTLVNRTAPVATVTASSPLLPSSGFLGQKGTCTFKILPPSSSREPILVTCAKVPPQPPIKVVSAPAPGTFTLFSPHPSATPVNLISLKPSPGQGAELGVKTVAVSAAPVGSGGLTVHQNPQTTIQTLTVSTIRPPPPAPTESEVTPEPSPPRSPVDRNRSEPELEQELACDLVDLDIICVDDEAGLSTTVTLAEAKRAVDVVVLDGSSSSEETDNSSDFEDETDGEGRKEEKLKHRYSHNELEKQRRAKMHQLFEGLRREVGITEKKMSKVFTLNRAVQVIQKLRVTNLDLMKKKMMLTKKRDHFLNTIAQATETQRHRSPEMETGNKNADVMEVVDLLEETEELTENSSDEEVVFIKTTDPVTKATDTITKTTNTITKATDPVTKATNTITKATDPVTKATDPVTKATDPVTKATNTVTKATDPVTVTNSVAVETVEETSGAQTRLDGDETDFDLDVLDAFRELGVVLDARHVPRTLLLQQAVQEIQTLQRETDRLRSLKICLIQQRKAFIREVAQRSGVSEKKILMKVAHLMARQREEEEEQHRAANQRPAAADRDSDSSARGMTVNDIIITSSYQLHQAPQAPPTLFYAPPTTTAVQTPVQPGPVTKATDPVTKATDPVTVTDSVAVETVEETSGAQTRLDGDETDFDLDVLDAFRELGVVLDARHVPRTLLLQQAVQEIQTLQRETDRLRSLKICLIQQRKAFIREVAQRSGVSEKKILMKVAHLMARQREEEEEEQHRAANQRPAAADGDSDSSARGMTVNDIIITSSYQLHQAPEAPPTLFYAPPTNTAVQQPQTHSHMVLQVLKPPVAPPPVSHNASVLRDKQRTVPNILSRSKTSAPPSSLIRNTVEESQHFHAMVPAEVLSLVGTALPGQQVVTLSPLMAAPTMLQTPSAPGMASVTLNIPSLTNQQIHLTSVNHPPTAADFNNLLQLVQPSTAPPQQPAPLQQEVPAPPAPVVPVGSDLSSDQIKDQDQPPPQTESPTTRGPSSPPSLGPGSGLQAEVPVGSALEPGEQQETGEETVSLTSLLNELVFLNQQTVSVDEEEEGHAHSPWLLQLDSDSEDTVASVTEEAGLNDHTEATQSVLQPRTVNGNTTGGALAPPPLLQMKVGGASVADSASRPMPRLVPLGLRGNPPS